MDTIKLVEEFHGTFGVAVPQEPTIDDPDINSLRISLLAEELEELIVALEKQDKVEVLDALVDLQYVLDGAFLSLGYANYKNSAFKEVHRSNMTKEGGTNRADGKIMKGPNYEEPNLRIILSGN